RPACHRVPGRPLARGPADRATGDRSLSRGPDADPLCPLARARDRRVHEARGLRPELTCCGKPPDAAPALEAGSARRTSAMADVLTVVAKIRAAKGKGDALAALLKEQVAAVMKAEPGCIVYRPHRSTKDPDLFIFYEQYKDDAAFDAHRKAPHLAAYRERREKEGLTEGPPEVEIYRSVTD